MEEISPAVKSADRVLDLFELLGGWGGEMSHADIVEALGIPKSSLTQLLRTLATRGYVEYSSSTKGYRLGAAFARLSLRTGQLRDLISAIEPLLADITRATQETSALNQRNGDMSEVVATVNSPQRLVSNMRLGDLAPLYATSGGKVILAMLPEIAREEYLARVKFEPITPRTIRGKRELQRQLAAIREAGVAYSHEEFTPGIVGIGVPLLAGDATLLGALNIAMPAVRHTPLAEERAIRALREAAERVRFRFTPAAGKGSRREVNAG